MQPEHYVHSAIHTSSSSSSSSSNTAAAASDCIHINAHVHSCTRVNTVELLNHRAACAHDIG